MDTLWRIELLGWLRATHAGGSVVARFRTRKTAALLAYLAFHAHRSHPRDVLVDLLWPESDPDIARTSLRVALSSLRRQLEPPGVPAGAVLLADRATVQLNSAAIVTDVAQFEAALANAAKTGSAAERMAQLTEAVRLYRGELLPGIYEEWTLPERERLAEAYQQALSQLATQREQAGDLTGAAAVARRAVAADPLREEAHRELIRLLEAAGQGEAARRQTEEMQRLLERDLGVTPAPEVRAAVRTRTGADDAGTGRARISAAWPPASSGERGEGALRERDRVDATPLPTGTVTFLFTDIEGSPHLWEQHPDAMRLALTRHNALTAQGIQQHGGTVVKSCGEGDSFFAVFARASDALAAACSLQQTLLDEPWPTGTPLRVRMALHTGEADLYDGDYYGPSVNRCARLRAVAHGGQVLLSLATAEIVRSALPEQITLLDLGRHRLQDLSHPEQIFQLAHPRLSAEFPPLRSLAARPQNLPVQPTPLLGREAELARLRELLRRDEVRLVTLTGPGGTGKTRLALQLAADLLDDFVDGVFFVELAPIRDPNRVAATITQVLGVQGRGGGGQPLEESLKDTLRDKQLLLLLDNFEQIIAAAPQISELLAAAPRLKVLVTSREVLRLRGEREFPVLPLPIPDPRRLPPLPTLSQYAAVQLFLQGAVSVQPDFAITSENAPAVAEICCRLDGLPLAIELAAARTRLFPPQALLARLSNRLKLLTGGARDLPLRQQTLRDTIAWSYDLLNDGEKTLFRRLSVFAGGCTPEAAERVVGAEGGGRCSPKGERAGPEDGPVLAPLEIDMLEGIASLLGQSLLRQEPGMGGTGATESEARFTMLETIREFGQECLAQSGEAEAIARQHAWFFLALAEEAEPELVRRDQGVWLTRLAAEQDNIRAALAWGLEREPETALRLAGALWRFWRARDAVAEGREALERGLAWAAEVPAEVRAKGLRAAALLTGNSQRARELIDEGLPLSRALGDRAGIAFWLDQQGQLAMGQGDYQAARGFLEESTAISREVGGRWCRAQSARHLGYLEWSECDYDAARRCHKESLAISQEIGDWYEIGVELSVLGNLAWWLADYREARRWHEESLALQRQIGAKSSIAYATYGLGDVALNQGDYEPAQRFIEESLALYRDLGNKRWMATVLDSLGELHRRQRSYEAARRSFEEMLAVAWETGITKLIGLALGRLGSAAWGQGENEAACRFYEEGLTVLRETRAADRPEGVMHLPLRGLGDMAYAAGEYGRARALYEESLAMQQRIKDRKDMADGLERLAKVAGAEGDAERAARLFGAAEALREAIGSPVPPVDRADYDHCVIATRIALGEEALAVAWAAGRAMALDEAIRCAIDEE